MLRIGFTALSCLAACQGRASLSSVGQEVVTTVPEQARQVDMTIYATHNHSSDRCWCTAVNETAHPHSACADHYRHGGQWRMNWEAYCERAENADCSESYPVVTGGRQAERATWVGANEHYEMPFDWGSCARWTWDTSWEGANFCQGQSRGMVAASEGSGSPNVFVAAGVGYAMRHGEDQATITPSVVIGVGQGGVGAGAGAGLDFSFRDQSWGNGYEIRCQYRCNWTEANMEVRLEEKCWAVGFETSDENPTSNGVTHAEAGLTIDNMWHVLDRETCTTEEVDAGSSCGSGGCGADAAEEDAAEVDAPEADAGVDAADGDGGVDCEHLCEISAEGCETYCPDAGVDAGPDAPVDAPVDAAPDAAVDAGADAAIDAMPDAGADAAVDAMPDAWMPDAPFMMDAAYPWTDAQP